MKQLSKAIFLLRLTGISILALGVLLIAILSQEERLSYFSYLVFQHQETIKTFAIGSIFLGVFYLFFSSKNGPKSYLSVHLFKGTMKAHPDILKELVETFFLQEEVKDMKIHAVFVKKGQPITFEMKTANLKLALYNLEDIESKLQVFMETKLGIKEPVEVQLFEL